MPNSDLPKLTFRMRIPLIPEKQQIYGMLYLQFEKQIQQEFKATSGMAGKQYVAAQYVKGVGQIPSSAVIAPSNYSVLTIPSYMTVPGHTGAAMFPINPTWVKVGRTGRGDFGIHEDLNIPGTIGCIALPTGHQWVLFWNAMKKLATQRILSIPLSVVYL